MSLIAAATGAGGWGVEGSLVLLAVVAVAGVGTGTLFLVSLLAYRRRRSPQYGLISVAVGALLARSVVGAGTVLGVVPMPVHHFVEHSLDFVVAALVLYAVYAHAPGSVSETGASVTETDATAAESDATAAESDATAAESDDPSTE